MFFKHLAISKHVSFARKPVVFHAFSDHDSIVQFWRLKVTCFAQKCDFGTEFVPPVGSKMRPLGHHFHQKASQRCSPPVPPWHLLADLGATSGPKRPRLRFHRFRDRFWSDFGLDFRPIWAWFRSNLSYHLWSLNGIPKALLVEVFARSFCMFHADSWYSMQAYWYSIKGELSRQVSRYSTKAFWYSASPTYPISPTYPMYPTYLTYPTYLDLSNLSNVSYKSNVSNFSNLSNWSNLSII